MLTEIAPITISLGTRPTWRDLLSLPETEKDPYKKLLEDVWKGFGRPVTYLRGIVDPESARRLLGLSQSEYGRLLALKLKRPAPFQKATIAMYEHAYRTWRDKCLSTYRRRKTWRRYGPTDTTIAAAAEMLCDFVSLYEQVYKLKIGGQRTWNVKVLAHCNLHGDYVLERVNSKHCQRCLGKR